MLGFDQCAEHLDHYVGSCLGERVLVGTGVRAQKGGEPASERAAIALGHAEQFADHRERERERKMCDEIDATVGTLGRDAVKELVDDRLHTRAQRLHPANGERGRDEATQSRVIRRIHEQHVPREGGPRKTFGHNVAARREGSLHVLRKSHIVQRDARLLVADHEPRCVAVGQRHRMHRPTIAHRGEHRERVVAVIRAPCGECLLRRHHGLMIAAKARAVQVSSRRACG